jgi:membrane protease YdiL (CAAX protease family)
LVIGLSHFHGYPPGPFGAVLAGIFGLGPGLLRLWTGGVALAIAVHIAADTAIFHLLTHRAAIS